MILDELFGSGRQVVGPSERVSGREAVEILVGDFLRKGAERLGSGFGFGVVRRREFRLGLGRVEKVGEQVGLGRLPRALLIAAGRDILCDQGEEFARKAGKRLTRIEFPGAVHLFITVPGQDKAFSTAVELASDFLL